jgi:beta-glucanase (GH16 family)
MNKKKLAGIVMSFMVTLNLSAGFQINAKVSKNENQKEDKWKLSWNDEFNEINGTGVNPDKWVYELGNGNGGWGNNELQYYTNSTDNVYQKDGNLVIKALKDDTTGQITSGRIKTQGKFSTKYGKLEARIKLPTGTGLWPAFWMMPEKDIYGGWAASGEIDIMENKGRLPGEVYGTLHYGGSWPNNKYSGNTYTFPEDESTAKFHTYSLEWEPGEIRWYVDGKIYQTQNNWYTNASNGEKYSYPAPFDQDFFVILNMAFGGNFDGGQKDESVLPGEMVVDYVRAFELKDKEYMAPVEPKVEIEALPAGAKTPTADGNLIYNGDFKENNIQENAGGSKDFGTGWNFVYGFEGNGSMAVDTINGTNYAKADITAAGNQNYSVQLIQLTTIGKGRWYKVSFDAKSNTNRIIAMKVGGGSDRGYSVYSDTYTLNLASEFTHFEKYFQMTADSDIKARLEFELGLNTNPVWIGNVRIEETSTAPKLVLNDGNLISNGAFDKGNIDRMTYWNFNKVSAVANANVPEDSRELAVMINYGGKSPESVIIDQKEIELKKGSSYKFNFKARAKANRTIKLEFLSKDGKIIYASQSFDLTKEMKEFAFEFKMNNDTDTGSQAVFKLGGNNNDVFIDDVSLFKGIDYTQINLYPLRNGDFSKGLDFWTPLPNIGDGADSAITAENGVAKIAISNVGPNPWSLMLNQEGFKLSKGVEYILAFDVKASVARNMEAIIENATYNRYLSKTIEAPAGSEFKHYEFTFKMDKDDTAGLKFLMGKTDSTVSSLPHEIYIDNVKFEVKDAPLKRTPELVQSITNNKLTYPIDITFVDDEAWRNAITTVKINETVLDTSKYTVSAGKITLAAENFTAVGDYTFSVLANGYAAASCIQNIKANDNLIITNGTFDTDTTGWSLYGADGSDAAIQSVDGQMKVNFTNYAGWEKWSTQVYQNTIKLEGGKTYVLKFDASSSIARDAWVEMNNMDQHVLALTPESKTFTFEFIAASTISNGKLNLLLGTEHLDGALFTKNQTVTFDNISITEKAGDVVTPPSTGPIVTNGTFDTDTTGWTTYTGDGSDAAVKSEDGQMKVNFTNYAGWEKWSTQVYQDTIKLEAGKTYVLKFDASSSIARNAWVEMNNMDQQVLTLTPESQTFTFEFTASSTITNGKLNFLLGTEHLDGKLFDKNQAVTLDNISITEKTATVETPTNGPIITNGTFDTDTAGWSLYGSDGSDASITSVDGQMKVNFPNYAGWEKWSTQVYQDTIKLEAGKTYVLKFDASSSIARSAWVEMNNMDQQVLALTPESQTFTFEFTAGSTISNGKLNFLLGTNNLDGALFTKNQTVTFDNISITEKAGDVVTPPSTGPIVTNGTFDTDTTGWTTYTGDGSDAAVKSENGQMKVNFTNYAGWEKWSTQVYQDTIKLEAGKTYVLKFDASSSAAREAWVEMNNMEQQVLALTPENKTFTFEFTASSTISNGKLNFLLGTNNLNGALFTKNQTVTFDNISITEK